MEIVHLKTGGRAPASSTEPKVDASEAFRKSGKASASERCSVCHLAENRYGTISTWGFRLRCGKLMSREIDRLYRFTEPYNTPLDLFDGDKQIAVQWLHSRAAGINRQSQINAARRSTGANDDLSLIRMI